MRKPFFRKERQCWYVEITRGKFVRLDPDEKTAYRMWERLRQISDYKHADATVEAIFEGWLVHFGSKANKQRTDKAVQLLTDCAEFLGPQSLARDITAVRIHQWMNKPRKLGKREYVWSVARQRDAAQFVKRAYKWAHVRGWLPPSDILDMTLRTPTPRDVLIPRSVHVQLMQSIRDGLDRGKPFGLVLIALWHSGARPIQIREVEAKHITLDGDWVFAKHKTSGKTGKALIVRASPCLQTLARILKHFRPVGPLFLSPIGEPWTKDGIARRFRRMRETLNLDQSITVYAYRHTYATDALIGGADLATVAALLGHSDAQMVSRVYGHLAKCDDPMRAAAQKVAARRLGQPGK
jgi:integrase